MKKKKRKYRKRRPVIKITSSWLELWGFIIGIVATFIDLLVLLVLLIWMSMDGGH